MTFSFRKPSDHSLHKKLLRVLQISLIVGLVLTGTTVAFVEIYLANNKLKADLETVANILGDRSIAALIFNDADAAGRNLQAARFHPSLVSVCLYHQNGELFSHYESAGNKHECHKKISIPEKPKTWIKHNAFSITLLSEIKDKGKSQGWLYLDANTKAIQQALLVFVFITAVVLVIIFTATASTTRHLLRRVMEPMNDLHNTATVVADDVLSPRRAAKSSNDEVGELVDVFNNMLDSISSETRALANSESRFRTLTSDAPIGIFQLDTDLNLEYMNEKFQSITGVTTLEGGFTLCETHVADDERERYEEFWKKNKSTDKPSMLEFRYHVPGNSREHHLMEHVSPLFNSDGGKKGYIGTLMDVTDLKDAQLELEKLAYFDPLTDLPNRRFFRDHLNLKLAEAKRDHITLAVMMIDLDNFKKVNDTLGHDAGDELLQKISSTLRNSLRDQDIVSRMGGDEFLIMLSSDESSSTIAPLAQRIHDELGAPHLIRNQSIEMSASIGIAVYPEDGTTTEELIKNSDIALYHAKELGRRRINFYSKELDNRIRENLRIETKLKKALNNGALDIYLQPQYSATSLEIVWSEALLRWNDESEGYISPDKFIPVAEESGLIHRIGHYVLERICYDLSEHGNYLSLAGIQGISINLSAVQLYSKNLVADIRHVLTEFHIDPCMIEIEITESMVMNDINKAIDVMTQLRDLGCRISIDDFGTGYSSLSYLSRFPISSVKIDRSFVSRIPENKNDMEIASAIIAMSQKLGLSVVAEGVETEEQKEFLVKQGCEVLQGFLLARPKPISHYVTLGRQRSIKLVEKD